jgi:SAM-dependent methyltransferase
MVTPTEADLAFVRLPAKLRVLYRWMRPVRLAGVVFRRVAGRQLRAARERPESVSGYSPSAEPVVQRMLELAEIGPTDVVYDLGCGDGRIVIEAARRFRVRGVGIDLDPQRIRECEENARAAEVQDLVSFRNQDVMQADLRPATVVMMYLPAAPTLKLVARLIHELPPGARILSHNSDPGGWDHVEVCARECVPSLLYLRRVANRYRP